MNPNSNSKFDRSSEEGMDQVLNYYFQTTKPVGLEKSFAHGVMSKIISLEKKKENDRWLYGGIIGWLLICVIVSIGTVYLYFDALISGLIWCGFAYSHLHAALGQFYEKIGSLLPAEIGSVIYFLFIGGTITFFCFACLWQKTRSPIHQIIK